ncbi:MAG: phosphate/phosphite/phosphonate ABC transporter substrate-binding protein [Lysobacterales bacterium]
MAGICKQRWWIAFWAALAVWLTTPCSAQAVQTTLVLGRVSDDPRVHYARLRPLLDYVVPRMADLGIREGRVLMARDAQQMTSYLRQGKVDWITETSGAALGFVERAQARILLRARRGGLYDYHSVFFTRRESSIQQLADLRGRALGFQHPMSTSAYLVPASMLLQAGLPLAIQASPLERPPPEFIGYAFARSEGNLVTWVHKGLVDAAVFSNQDWDEMVRESPDVAADLRIFAESREFPRALELVRRGLDPRIEARLKALLLAAHEDPLAAEALAKYQRTERFDEIDAQTSAVLDELRTGVLRVRAEIE